MAQVMLQRRAVVLLIAALSVLQSNSKVALQLQLATTVFAVNLVAHYWARPYKDAYLNRLGALGLISVCCQMLLSCCRLDATHRDMCPSIAASAVVVFVEHSISAAHNLNPDSGLWALLSQ